VSFRKKAKSGSGTGPGTKTKQTKSKEKTPSRPIYKTGKKVPYLVDDVAADYGVRNPEAGRLYSTHHGVDVLFVVC
jgi:hypothetical protein